MKIFFIFYNWPLWNFQNPVNSVFLYRLKSQVNKISNITNYLKYIHNEGKNVAEEENKHDAEQHHRQTCVAKIFLSVSYFILFFICIISLFFVSFAAKEKSKTQGNIIARTVLPKYFVS